jgi:hypothetical protein
VKAIKDDYDALSYSAALVAPHSTASGFLWYDIRGLEKPVLKGSQMYIKMVRKSDGKELFNFNIAFDKYLQMQ